MCQMTIRHTLWTLENVLPVYHARLLNESGLIHPPLPSLGPSDILLLSGDEWVNDWSQNVVRFASGNNTRIEYSVCQCRRMCVCQCIGDSD